MITNISERLMKEFFVKESSRQTMEEAKDYVVKEYFPASKGWTFEKLSDEAYLIRKV